MADFNPIFLYGGYGLGSCLGFVLLIYNLVAGVLFLREDTEGSASGLAKASWALGVMALFAWPLMCFGLPFALGAMLTSRIERRRIYRGDASLAGATPVRMGSINGSLSLLMQFGLVLAAVVGMLTGAT
ncbi:MAG: hypothetical protein KTR31_01175 [Myxococcales bacterium]|nr:hypothetical protein [Myxococcales bacterium]